MRNKKKRFAKEALGSNSKTEKESKSQLGSAAALLALYTGLIPHVSRIFMETSHRQYYLVPPKNRRPLACRGCDYIQALIPPSWCSALSWRALVFTVHAFSTPPDLDVTEISDVSLSSYIYD